MKRALLDTDTLSYFLKGHSSVLTHAAAYVSRFGKLEISSVSYYELRRGLIHARATRKLSDFEAFVATCHVWSLGESEASEAADICAELWARGEPVDDSDVLIAGIARAHGLTIVTNNVKHFERIAGLDVQNWTKAPSSR